MGSTRASRRPPRSEPGTAAAAFLGQPAAADLDGDGRLEIVATSLDRHVYAWHADGTPVDGFPVLVVDPATVESVDPTSHSVTFKAGANAKEGGGMVAPPSVADLDGDGRPEIVVGAQEGTRARQIATALPLALLAAAPRLGNTRRTNHAHGTPPQPGRRPAAHARRTCRMAGEVA